MLLAAMLCALTATGGAIDHDHDEPGLCKAALARLGPVAPAVGWPEAPGGRDPSDTDVLHYELDIELIPSPTWLGGTNTISVRSLINGLATFEVRLRDVFTIGFMQIGATPVTWQRLSETTVQVTLDRAYNVGEEFDLIIDYDGSPVSLGFGSIEFTSHGGYPLIFTLSEPYYAHTWWPTKEENTDKATGALKITVPEELTVASNGLLVAVNNVGGGRDQYHWLTGYQTATYLFSFSAGRYNEFGDTYAYAGGSMPCDFFIFPDSDTQANRDKWLMSIDMLETFEPIFGLYPFIDEKYGIYQFGFGGGMEHQTMTGQGGFGEGLTAHELAHQWWGDMITCATWQDIWLNEGFATYSEALWQQRRARPARHHGHQAPQRRERQRLRARRRVGQPLAHLLQQLQLPQRRVGAAPVAPRRGQ